MEDGDAGLVQRLGELARVARRRGDEPHALVVYEVDDAWVAHEHLGDVEPERLVGEVAHLADLVADLVELARRRLDDAHRARVRDRRRQLRPGDVPHRRLQDRVLDAEQLGDARADRHGSSLTLPVHRGSRFSTHAMTPSRASGAPITRWWYSVSSRSASSASSAALDHNRRFDSATDCGAVLRAISRAMSSAAGTTSSAG